MNNNPLVSIIITTWNGEKYLIECILSLLNQSYKNLEIILVDNASSDGSVELVKENFPCVQVIQNSKNLGFAEGSNIGLLRAKGELIALFNQDAVAEKKWLEKLINAIKSSDNIAAVAGKVYFYGDEHGKDAISSSWSKINPYNGNAYNFSGDEPFSKVDCLTGCAMLVRQKVIDEIGLLDPGYFMYFDETDWCARMIRAGYDLLYIPNATVRHVVSASLGESRKKSYYLSRSRIRFALKNFDMKYMPIFILFFFMETLYIFIKNIRNLNFSDTELRLEVIIWNLLNLRKTLRARHNDLGRLHKNISYNRSLPLKKYKVGLI